jgi:hypothetical protein
MHIATGPRMEKLTDEFRKGWQGVAPPSLGLSIGFAVACLLVATLARWGLAHVRPCSLPPHSQASGSVS